MHVIRCLEVTGNGCDFVAIDLQNNSGVVINVELRPVEEFMIKY